MEYFNNVNSDNDLKLQRLMNGHATTRGPNATTRVKQTRGMQCKKKYLHGTYTAVDYLNAISLTIGHENINPVLAPAHFQSSDNLGDITDDMNEEDNRSQFHVSLLSRVTNFAHFGNCVHGGFCKTYAN